MKIKFIIATVVLLWLVSVDTLADRKLERIEILQVLKELTSQPRKAWIPAGTIEATREEYKAPQTTNSTEIDSRIDQAIAEYQNNPVKYENSQDLQEMRLDAIPFNVRYALSNEYTMTSKVAVKYDGNRFYWQIIVDSRVDSVKPGAELAANFYIEQFDLDWNQNRVFAWDGDKYVTYFRPGNSATITTVPSAVNGPLTAGIIPWGRGRYRFEQLSEALLSGMEVESDADAQLEIRLTVITDEMEEAFALIPSKDYAVRQYTATFNNGSMTVQNYGDYQWVGDRWCPRVIIIEKYDTATTVPKLMESDLWDFTSISNTAPEESEFHVDFEYDALIEDFRFGPKPMQFRYSPPEAPTVKNVDVAELLENRLEIVDSAKSCRQNCATFSLKYICGKLGIRTAWQDLSKIVNGSDKKTSLLEMKEFVEQLGLKSLAVKTDLETLGALADRQTILHLPTDNHYVVLGNIGNDYVRLIDLDKNDFYYRRGIEHFERMWDNTALIVGKNPITERGEFAIIDDNLLNDMVGAASCQDCNLKIQDANDSGPCVQTAWCGGAHSVVFERWACGSSTYPVSCSEVEMPGTKDEVCISDPNLDCVGDGEWVSRDISACK